MIKSNATGQTGLQVHNTRLLQYRKSTPAPINLILSSPLEARGLEVCLGLKACYIKCQECVQPTAALLAAAARRCLIEAWRCVVGGRRTPEYPS
jgi:hypothetical protein